MKGKCKFNFIELRIRRFLLVVGLLTMLTPGFCEPLSGALYAQQVNFNFKLKNAGFSDLIQQIKKNSDYYFIYKDSEVSELGKLNKEFSDARIDEVLMECLKGSSLTYKIEDNVILIRKIKVSDAALPQNVKTIQGVVKDATGNVLPGVSVFIKGTTLGVATSSDGTFKLTLPEMKAITLTFSFVGMKPKEVSYTGQANMNVVLEEEVNQIDEVVVTGMFNRKKEGFTGSATKVTGEEIKRMTSGNILRALEMLDPGFRMNVSNVAGSNPNALPDFEMRGQSNMGDYSAEDVVVMRGDIDTRPNQPLFVLDGIIDVGVTKIIDLDPEQIESITLLKDAAAMVIYGSRASNGVVVVETKAPQQGTLRVTYNGNYKIQYPDLTDYHLLEAKDKLELERRAGYYDETSTSGASKIQLDSYKRRALEVERGVNTYWLSQPLETVFIHRHGFNLEGGDQSLRYKIYFGLNQAPGVMIGSGTNSKSGSIDIRYRHKGLLISNQMYVDYTVGDRTSPYGSFSTYGTINPYYRVKDEKGNLLRVLDYAYDENGNPIRESVINPMYDVMYNQKDQSTAFEIRDAFRAEYTPIDNLRLSVDVNLSKLNQELDQFKPSAHSSFLGKALEEKGSYNWNRTNTINYDVNFTASYNKVFDKHLLSVFARYAIEERYKHNAGVSVTGFPNDQMDEVFLGTLFKDVNGSEGKSRSIGFVGTVNYSYDQRYAVDFSIRVDASSEFGKNNRFAPFWSTGLRWNLDKESFIKKLNFFDELVLRGTYGVTGSQGFSPYQSLQMYTYKGMLSTYHSSDVIGTKLYSMGNPDLKWQKTDSWNFGLDFNLCKRIISGRFEYYRKNTRNTLLDYSLAPSVGFATIPDNMGNISNKGYEATLRVMPYNNVQKRLNFNIVVNGGHNINRIEKISYALEIKNKQSADRVMSRPLPRYEEGYSQSIIWAVRSLGIDPITGREILLSRDGQRTSVWNGIDQVPVGDTEPKLRGSLSVNVNWRGWSLSVSGQYHFGGQIYNRTLLDKIENANLRDNVDERAFTERWKEVGDQTFFKGITREVSGQSTNASSRFVMDDNEFTINTINLQYRFEQRYNKFLKNIGVSSASVGLYLEDLLHLSTVKMERGIDYPFARQVSLSLNIAF